MMRPLRCRGIRVPIDIRSAGRAGGDTPALSFRPRVAQVRALVRPGRASPDGLAPVLALLPGGAWAHAFVSRSEPRAGATLGESPAQIRIWFDGPVEPVSIDIRVENEASSELTRITAA